MATEDVEDLDLDELDAELTDQLEDEDQDQDPRERHTLSEIRAALRRTKGKLEQAFEDGKAAGRDEEQRDQAWRATGIPERVRTLMGDVDPRDSDALAAKVQELQRDGLRWGDDTAATAVRVEDEQRAATLERMSSLAAGGSVVNVEDGKAQQIKARIDSGQEVPPEELGWFLEHVNGAADAIGSAQRRGY
jgi:hypothetical protein